MYVVRVGALPAAVADCAGAPIRVPQAPQNANPGVTMRPQVGHAVPSTVGGLAAFPAAVPAAAGRDDQAGDSEATPVADPPMYPEADALAAAVPAAEAPPF